MFLDKQNLLINTNITKKGRSAITMGDFNISFFGLGDTEIDYTLEEQSILSAINNHPNIVDLIGYERDCELSPIQNISNKEIKIEGSNKIFGLFTSESQNLSGVTTNNVCPNIDLTIDYGLIPSSPNSLILNIGSSDVAQGDVIYIVFHEETPNFDCSISSAKFIDSYNIISNSGGIITLNRNLPSGYTDYEYYVYRPSDIDSTENNIIFDDCTNEFTSNTTGCTSPLKFNIIPIEELAGTCIINETELLYDNCGNEIEIPKRACDRTPLGKKYSGLAKMLGYYSNCGDNIIDSEKTCEDVTNSFKDTYQKSVGIIYLDEQCCEGDYFSKNLKLHLPSLMYHRRSFNGNGTANKIGMTFCSSNNMKNLGNVKYYDLLENEDFVDSEIISIGKVFPELKIVVIEDEEILAALSNCSNRKYTLPSLKGIFENSINGIKNGLVKRNQKVYITYRLDNNTLHNLNYSVLENLLSNSKDVAINLEDVGLLPYDQMNGDINLIYQITDGERPDPCNWKEFMISGTTLDLENNTVVLDSHIDSISKPFDHNVSYNCDCLYGDESFLYGSISVSHLDFYSQLNVQLQIDSDSLITGKNCTFGDCDELKISEIGLYNSNQDLMLISKLSIPVKIQQNKVYNFDISYNF